MKDIKVSIIIVSYNNLDILIDCIESIFKYNDIGTELEIIIVDNSTCNNIYNYIKNNYSECTIIKNANYGFGQANNIGAKIAKGEILVFLNPDTILIEPIFRFTLLKFYSFPKMALFGVKLLDKQLKMNMSFYFIDKHDFFSGQIIKLLNKLNLFFKDSMYISGADLFVRKSEFYKAGQFDNNIFLYYEEPDLIKRIKNNGCKISFFPTKRIIHLEGKTTHNYKKFLVIRLQSAKYYSCKYNLNLKKQIRDEIVYNKIKYLIVKYCFKKIDYSLLKTILILKKFGDKID